MRRTAFVAALGVLFAVGGVSLTSAYFSDSVRLTASFVAVIPDVTASPSATPTLSATVTPQSSPTVTATRTRPRTLTRTATPSVTATPTQCGDDARVRLRPASVRFEGDGSFSGMITVENTGKHATALAVVLGFHTGDGARFLGRLMFGNAQIWQIGGVPDFTLYNVGAIAPGETIEVAFTLQPTAGWLVDRRSLKAEIDIGIASGKCLKHPQDVTAKITLKRAPGSASATASASGTPSPGDTPAPPATATDTPKTTPTSTVAATDTPATTGTPVA